MNQCLETSDTTKNENEKEHKLKLIKMKDEAEMLKKWEYATNLKTTLKEEIEEDKLFLGDTEDVITRLKIRERFLMLT